MHHNISTHEFEQRAGKEVSKLSSPRSNCTNSAPCPHYKPQISHACWTHSTPPNPPPKPTEDKEIYEDDQSPNFHKLKESIPNQNLSPLTSILWGYGYDSTTWMLGQPSTNDIQPCGLAPPGCPVVSPPLRPCNMPQHGHQLGDTWKAFQGLAYHSLEDSPTKDSRKQTNGQDLTQTSLEEP